MTRGRATPHAEEIYSCRNLFGPSDIWAVDARRGDARGARVEREFFIDNLLVRIHRWFRWTVLVPWEFEFPFPGSLISTFLEREDLLELLTASVTSRYKP